ncbi:MAG: molybdate transport system ATP-binding protein [Parasphingorhabdus sp.]|jgi:molybdate transport system ATP-binding protein
MPSAGLEVLLHQSSPIPLDVSLECGTGELIALVGPSGSGKSTILRCIAGLHEAKKGYVHCGDECWWDSESSVNRPVYQRSIGVVLQSYGLFRHMSVAENIMSAMSERSADDKMVQVKKLLDLVNLSGLDERKPAQLSGGQQQRVAVARALARDPQVLLLDEPFSAVDLMTRQKLCRELARIRQTLNIPIVLVTHDLEEAQQLADSLCIVHRGKTLQTDSPDEIMNRPASVDVARLVGLTNIFAGEIVGHDQATDTTMISWLNQKLTCRLNKNFQSGEKVSWVVPKDRVILHQRRRPSKGEAENPVEGYLSELTIMGGNVMLEFHPQGSPDASISFSVPRHVAERNKLAVGEMVGISLKAEGIHLMHKSKEP